MAGAGEVVKLRLVLTAPPKGVTFSLEGKNRAVEKPVVSTGADLAFDLSLRVDMSGAEPRWLGDYARGGVSERFFYFCSGIYAGAHVVTDGRRGKAPLGSIPRDLLDRALKSGGTLVATTAGSDKHGKAACATIKNVVWTLA